MRSDRVFDALQTLRNRYMLCQLASKATRKFHKPNTRIQETMNEVLDRIADSERQAVLSEPENVSEAQRRGGIQAARRCASETFRSEEHTSELQSRVEL